MKKKLHSIQTALFPNNFKIPDENFRSKFANDLQQKFGVDFEKIQVFPIPLNAPDEIPRFILQSVDGKKQLAIGINKIDIIQTFDTTEQEEDSLGKAQNAQQRLTEKVFAFLEEKRIVIGRFGLVSLYRYDIDQPLQYFYQNFLSKNLPYPAKYSIITYSLPISETEPKFNRVINIASNEGQPVVNLQVDINTLAEIASVTTFDSEMFRKYFESALEQTRRFAAQFPQMN